MGRLDIACRPAHETPGSRPSRGESYRFLSGPAWPHADQDPPLLDDGARSRRRASWNRRTILAPTGASFAHRAGARSISLHTLSDGRSSTGIGVDRGKRSWSAAPRVTAWEGVILRDGRTRGRRRRRKGAPTRQSPAARSPSHQSPSCQIGIQPERGCHRVVTRLYRPLARKRDRAAGAGASRLLLSSAGFVSFRAPIDSVVDPGGQPRRPKDPFLSLRCGFGPLGGWKNETVDSEVALQ